MSTYELAGSLMFFIRFHLVQCLYARSRAGTFKTCSWKIFSRVQPCQEMEAQQARPPHTYGLIFVCPMTPIHS